ncbi:hypothetical protein IWQ60_010410, partial [Tieghemiomyces parasiticus]
MVMLNGTSLEILGQTSPGDQLTTSCLIKNEQESVVFIGGNFTHFAGVESRGIVAYDLQSSRVVALGRGVDGNVLALHCDSSRMLVYVGGLFTGPLRDRGDGSDAPPTQAFGPNAAIWSPSGWLPVPFSGLDGYVGSITMSPDDSTVYFGGNFTATLDDSSTLPPAGQPINLARATVTSGNDNLNVTFANPTNAICTKSLQTKRNPWLLRDLMPGYWRADFKASLRPSFLRLRNADITSRGTMGFRLDSSPQNTPITLSYTDPRSDQRRTCSQSCPLAQGSQWQEFEVVDDVTVSGIQITIEKWFGQGAGLAGVELYQRDISVSPLDVVNPACNSVPYRPDAQITGGWTQITVPVTDTTFLQATVNPSQNPDANVVTYHPYVTASGTYKVALAVPGCQYTSDCSSRVSVKLRIQLYPGQDDIVTVSQNQFTDTNVPVYSGFVGVTTGDFIPSVTLSLADGASGTAVKLIAARLVLQKVASFDHLGGVLRMKPQGKTAASIQATSLAFDALKSPLADGAIVNTIVARDTDSLILGGYFAEPSTGAHNLVLYNGGRMVAPMGGGVNNQVLGLVLVGANDVYVGGAFTNVMGSPPATNLNRLARLSLNDQRLHPIAGGVNGTISSVTLGFRDRVPTVFFAGQFGTIFKDGNVTTADLQVGGLAAWNAQNHTWADAPFLNGAIASADGLPVLDDNSLHRLQATNGTATPVFFGGSFSAVAASRVPGVVGMNDRFELSPVFNAATLSAAPSYANVSSLATHGATVLSGLYYMPSPAQDSDSPNLVIAGRFQGPSDDVRNIAVVSDQKTIQPLGAGLSGEIHALALADSQLFIGGIPFYNNSNDAAPQGEFQGFAIWNFQNEEYVSSMLPLSGLDGSNYYGGRFTPHFVNSILLTNSTVFVRTIVPIPSTQTVLVAGLFNKAGTLTCESVCLFNYKNNQWQSLGAGLPGIVNTLSLVGDKNEYILAGGTFTVSGQTQYLAVYGTEQGMWGNFTAADALPGPVQSLAMVAPNATVRANVDTSKIPDPNVASRAKAMAGVNFYVAGTVGDTSDSYLYYWNGSSLAPVVATSTLKGSLVRSLLLVPLTRNSDSTSSNATSSLATTASSPVASSPSSVSGSAVAAAPTPDLHRRDAPAEPPMMTKSVALVNRGSTHTKRDDASAAPPFGLMVSGSLNWANYGTLSTMLYDISDKSWFPLLRAINEDGTAGSVGSVFHPLPDNVVQNRAFLSTALVIIISIAISLALVFFIVLIGLAYIYWRNKRRTGAAITATAAAASAPGMYGKSAGPGENDFNPRASKFEPWAADNHGADAALAAGAAAAAGLGVRGLRSEDSGVGQYGNLATASDPSRDSTDGQPPKSTAATLNSNNRSSTSPYHYYGRSQPHIPEVADSSAPFAAAAEAAVGAAAARHAHDSRPLSIGSVLHGYGYDSSTMAQGPITPAPVPASRSPSSAGLTPAPVRQHQNMAESPRSPHRVSNFDDGELFNQGLNHIEMDSLNHRVNRTEVSGGASPSHHHHEVQAAAAAAALALGVDTVHHSEHPQQDRSPAPTNERTVHSYHLDSPTLPVEPPLAPYPLTTTNYGNASGGSRDTGNVGGSDGVAAFPTVPDHTETSRKAVRSSAETAKLQAMAPSDRTSTIRDSLKDHPVYYAKFPFNAREHGELEFRAGERIFVIDNSDDIWWM